ncbi:mas-related G-protein coupled receptor member H-like [Heteronotia binoei]|uniref:mas-related G-protein coupled receptor member H-like n=1 Tax=Heteronotia binoei TaxID=13085 RepID=UPI00292D7C6D|nr:mas-related G-protein coupled receptor member H-like [Heteronotia binoei]
MVDGFNLKTLFSHKDEKDLRWFNYIGDQFILSVFIIFFCIIGLVGNGNLIRLLGFRMKRKPFAIYILNLAVADFGSLVFLLPLDLCFNPPSFYDYPGCPSDLGRFLFSLLLLTCSSRLLLLTAISIDRWVSVFFPNWYRHHRSPALSTTVCVFIWALPFALIGVPLFLYYIDLIRYYYAPVFLYSYALTSLICVLILIISTLTLFTRVCLKSPRCQCGSLLRVVLLMFLSFFLFMILTTFFTFTLPVGIQQYFGLWTSLNSSINPLIYFLAGRQNGGKFQERMKAILQRVFKEERDTKMGLQPRTQTML